MLIKKLREAAKALSRAAEDARTAEARIAWRTYQKTSMELRLAMLRTFRPRLRDALTGVTQGEIASLAVHHSQLAWVRIGRELTRSLSSSTHAGVRALSSTLRFLGVPHDATRLTVAQETAHQAMLDLRLRSVRTAGARAGSMLRAKLALQPVEESTVARAIQGVSEQFGSESWRVARVARTEASRAYNQAQLVAADEIEDLWMRWTERINDFSGLPMDNRVGEDSKALHGQVARPGETFTMPLGGPSKMVGRQWTAPPNRPNDRAILVPWMPGWDVPAYVVEGGRKKPLR